MNNKYPANYMEALKGYVDKQDDVTAAFKAQQENRLKEQALKAEQLRQLSGQDFSGQTNLSPLMAFADYLNANNGQRTNLSQSYQKPTVQDETLKQARGLDQGMDNNGLQSSAVGVQNAKSDSDMSQNLLQLLSQRDIAEQNQRAAQKRALTMATGMKPSEFEKKRDAAFAKTYNDQFGKGEMAELQANRVNLSSLMDDFRAGEKNLTGTDVGMVPEFVRAVTNPDSVDAQNRVNQIIMGSLRATLGAQFTEKEGQKVLNATYNNKLDEDVILKRLKILDQKLRRMAEARLAAKKYADQFGTLKGFTGSFTEDNEQLRDELIGAVSGASLRTDVGGESDELAKKKARLAELMKGK